MQPYASHSTVIVNTTFKRNGNKKSDTHIKENNIASDPLRPTKQRPKGAPLSSSPNGTVAMGILVNGNREIEGSSARHLRLWGGQETNPSSGAKQTKSSLYAGITTASSCNASIRAPIPSVWEIRFAEVTEDISLDSVEHPHSTELLFTFLDSHYVFLRRYPLGFRALYQLGPAQISINGLPYYGDMKYTSCIRSKEHDKSQDKWYSLLIAEPARSASPIPECDA
jgi:hypothetical protein